MPRPARALLAAALAATTLAACAAPLRLANVPRPTDRAFLPAVASLSSSIMARGTTTGFWSRPDEIYRVRLEAVRRARRTVHFETYYMTPGRRADAFAAALAERARAGVAVRFIADADGTKTLPRAYWQRLRKAGVEVRRYNRFHFAWPWTYNTRTHRKILAIDGEVAFTGGTGVSDEWDAGPGRAAWADVEVRVAGPVVAAMEGVFAQHWVYLGGRADLGPEVFQPVPDRGVRMLLTPSGPRDGGSPLQALYHTSILAARERIWIASPYFLPSRADQKALIEARRRGVDVRVLSVGPKNDQRLTYFAVQERARALVRGGVRIAEYQPAMMHAKVLLVDDAWVVTGSANYDPRSFFHNEELTLAANDPALVRGAEAFFHEAFARSSPLHPAILDGRDLLTETQARAMQALWWYL